MFEILSVDKIGLNSKIAILDSEDFSVEMCTVQDIKSYINLGIDIKGLVLNGSTLSFNGKNSYSVYSDENFIFILKSISTDERELQVRNHNNDIIYSYTFNVWLSERFRQGFVTPNIFVHDGQRIRFYELNLTGYDKHYYAEDRPAAMSRSIVFYTSNLKTIRTVLLESDYTLVDTLKYISLNSDSSILHCRSKDIACK